MNDKDLLKLLRTYGEMNVEEDGNHYSVTLFSDNGEMISGTVGSFELFNALNVVYGDILDMMLNEVGL
jgi:hypothetical protein